MSVPLLSFFLTPRPVPWSSESHIHFNDFFDLGLQQYIQVDVPGRPAYEYQRYANTNKVWHHTQYLSAVKDIFYPSCREYPFKPPKITFKTKIYHPNIDEKGQVCLPVISAENWKPATKTDQISRSLIALVNDPQPEHPIRADLAEEYSEDRKKFCKNAEEFTKKYGEQRPVD